MTVNSVNLVPELQYYYNKFLMSSVLNKFKIPHPSSISPVYPENTFLRLLFDETWEISYQDYKYLYREEVDKLNWPSMALTRLMIYPSSAKYYVCYEDTTPCDNNIFNLQPDDHIMLSKLLTYRCDSTSCDISDIVYEDLGTTLSKLIYLYLDLKINGNITEYNNETLLSDGSNVLESCYESYVIDNMFKYISDTGT